jgi:endonuclease/exonuclease/phosphatase family metal-dependent hydrolase
MTTLRIATWNVNAFNPARAGDKLRLLDLIEWDVALLQEVGGTTFATFTSGPLRGVHALQLVEGYSGKKAHGVAILVKGDAELAEQTLIPLDDDGALDPRYSARALHARLRLRGANLCVASFHAPHAAAKDPAQRQQYRDRKNAVYRALDRWVREQATPLIVGMDGNVWNDATEPMQLPPDDERFAERTFHDPAATHGLRDAFLEHLRGNRPDLLRRRQLLGHNPNDGALAVTYQRSSNNHPKVNRMDRIYVSPELVVRNVETLYDEALTVGSDHAMVVAELELRPRGDQPDDDLYEAAEDTRR